MAYDQKHCKMQIRQTTFEINTKPKNKDVFV